MMNPFQVIHDLFHLFDMLVREPKITMVFIVVGLTLIHFGFFP